MSRIYRHSYTCTDCGNVEHYEQQPTLCKFCGSTNIVRTRNLKESNHNKAKVHANELVEELNSLIPKINDVWDNFVELWVDYEKTRRVLTNYAFRGIIEKKDIPIFEKKNLIDELYTYRKKRHK